MLQLALIRPLRSHILEFIAGYFQDLRDAFAMPPTLQKVKCHAADSAKKVSSLEALTVI
jgi:hypothetical protein